MTNPTQSSPAAEKTGEATPQPQRRRRASTGGFRLKLDAEERPGFVRRFVNADPLRIKEMQELGYSVVGGASDGRKRTDGLGTTIARHAGKDDTGKAYQAVLMETPDDLYRQGVTEKEDGRKAFEDTIRRGLKTDHTPDGAYIPKGAGSTINHSG
jgi:hypothetical protein